MAEILPDPKNASDDDPFQLLGPPVYMLRTPRPTRDGQPVMYAYDPVITTSNGGGGGSTSQTTGGPATNTTANGTTPTLSSWLANLFGTGAADGGSHPMNLIGLLVIGVLLYFAA